MKYNNEDKIALIHFFIKTHQKHIAADLGYRKLAIINMLREESPTRVQNKVLPVLFKRIDTILPTLLKMGFDIGKYIPLAIQRGLNVRQYVPNAVVQYIGKPTTRDKISEADKTVMFAKNRQILSLIANTRIKDLADKMSISADSLSVMSTEHNDIRDVYVPVLFQIYDELLLIAVDRGYDLEPFLEAAIQKGLQLENYVVRQLWCDVRRGKANLSENMHYITLPNHEVLQYKNGRFNRYNAAKEGYERATGITHFSDIPQPLRE
ncbi:MAG: hypothetical protein ACPG5B_16305 [Chitinophagales bacterium]